MAHGAYAKRRVAGRSSLGGGYGARFSRDRYGVRAKEGDRKAIRNQIRSIERLLKKTLPLEIKNAHEKHLEDLRRQAELHAYRKLALRDRKLKFYERRKLERRIRRLEKQHRWNFDHPCQGNMARQIYEVTDQLSRLKEDLEYVRFFPKSERYVSLFSDDEITNSRRKEIREKIKAKRTAAAAAGTELEETGSEDDEPMDLSEDDMFIEGSSSDDADADDEWTDKSPRRGDDRDDTSRETSFSMPAEPTLTTGATAETSSPHQRTRRESAARVLMPPPRARCRTSTSSCVVGSRNRLSANYLSSSNSEEAMATTSRRGWSSSGISSEDRAAVMASSSSSATDLSDSIDSQRFDSGKPRQKRKSHNLNLCTH